MLTFRKTYHAMCFDHLLPIFFEDERAVVDSISTLVPSSLLYFPGGLGLSIPTVGMISKYPTSRITFWTVSGIGFWRAESFRIYLSSLEDRRLT